MHFLDRIPYVLLIALALLMALMPFAPEPHLLEKAKMLMAGALTRPLDMFDLFWHLLPTLLLGAKWWRDRNQRDGHRDGRSEGEL